MQHNRLPQSVAVIYNSVDETSPVEPPDLKIADEDTIKMAQEVADNLKTDFAVQLIDIPFENPESAKNIHADLVFNLCEGTGYEFACAVIDALESAQLPYVGANALNYRIGSDKALLKEYLNREDIPSPQGQRFQKSSEDLNPRLNFPLLVKPEFEHSSVGITQQSVVENERQLRRQLKLILSQYGGGALVEEFIDGRELQLTFIGNNGSLQMLPVKEILFVGPMVSKWHVVTFAAKWEVQTDEYQGTPSVCPAQNLSDREIEQLHAEGSKVFEKCVCQDYTRIDVRYDQEAGIPYILDVNPNPDLSSDAAVAKAAEGYGWNYRKLLTELIASAWERTLNEKGQVIKPLRRKLRTGYLTRNYQ
jgi:D-alanine-D-alanine ligase